MAIVDWCFWCFWEECFCNKFGFVLVVVDMCTVMWMVKWSQDNRWDARCKIWGLAFTRICPFREGRGWILWERICWTLLGWDWVLVLAEEKLDWVETRLKLKPGYKLLLYCIEYLGLYSFLKVTKVLIKESKKYERETKKYKEDKEICKVTKKYKGTWKEIKELWKKLIKGLEDSMCTYTDYRWVAMS